jgi:cytochrome c5
MKKRDFIVLLGVAILIAFLMMAPEETTKPVPHNDTHAAIFTIVKSDGKKLAEKTCVQCHNDQGVPFPPEHPPKSRCLFCHKVR